MFITHMNVFNENKMLKSRYVENMKCKKELK